MVLLPELRNDQLDRGKLLTLIVEQFNEDELRTLCFDMHIRFEDLPSSGLSSKTRDLVELCARHKRLAELVQVVVQKRPHLQEAGFVLDPRIEDSPFKGLQYFDEIDEPRFFGRDTLTNRLVAHLLQPRETAESSGGFIANRFLAVVGASGSGKSSVVRAGLIPALRCQTSWPIHILTPTAHPLEALATTLTQDSESVTATATFT